MDKRRPTSGTTEGPYYKADSPERTKIREPGVPGDELTLTGSVLDINGAPVAGAWLDFWQADGKGKYDNKGFVLRGHQSANRSGKYRLETVVPGSYPGRTPHIHVKVRAGEGRPTLTAQLFLPGLSSNATDSIFRDDLVMVMSQTPAGRTATFDFVLDQP
jgi:protocatechuate 3,4-dioxygenase beta subunit